MEEQEDFGEQSTEGSAFNDLKTDLLFDYIDKNDDGKISKNELMTYANLKGFNPTDEEKEEFINEKFANDDDNYLDRKEFEELGDEFLTKLRDPRESLEEALEELDKNGDGHLDINELSDLLENKGTSPLTKQEIQELIDECNSKVDEEYVEGDRTYVTREALLAVLLDPLQ